MLEVKAKSNGEEMNFSLKVDGITDYNSTVGREVEIQIKTTMRYHFIHFSLSNILQSDKQNSGEGGCGKIELSYSNGGNINSY